MKRRLARSRSKQPAPASVGIDHLDAERALQKTGFRIAGQGKHIVMSEWIETAKQLGRTIPEPRGRPMFA